jgi:hypothetical protein
VPLAVEFEYIQAATKGPNDAGIPFAFDQEGMQRTGKTRDALVSIDISDEPLKTSLRKLLKPLGLTYEVRKGVLTFTSEPAQG